MAVLAGRKEFVRFALFAMCAIFLVGTLGCSVESRARGSLKKVVHREIKQFNKYHLREVKPNIYLSGDRFYRTYHERVDPVVNMRRTNSLDTPYIATISFLENIYLTHRHTSRKDCAGDNHYILSHSSRREIIYAFVNGLWKRKETY